MTVERLKTIYDRLADDVDRLRFGPPVTHVYNPLNHARDCWHRYLELAGGRAGQIVLLGMNPGPWGMNQTGVPFGEVGAVRDWLGIDCSVTRPAHEHPKRPVLGLDCPRSEVSGQRVWNWARERYRTPAAFFDRFFIANYCPLIFLEDSGRNRTPDKLRAAERDPLLAACDEALREAVEVMRPRLVIGIGRFAERRAAVGLGDGPVEVAGALHPSPASPAANRGWAEAFTARLEELGVSR